MKSVKLMTFIAAAVCAFAVSNARAQTTTNFVTLTVTINQQGPIVTNSTAHGETNIVFGPTSVKTYSTTKFIQEVLGPDIGITNFTSAAKLAQTNQQWVVIDGANTVDVSSDFSTSPGDVQIEAGTQSQVTFLAAPKITGLVVLTLNYNDGKVQFSVSGLANGSTMDTVPNNAGDYTETGKTSVMTMAGLGSNQTGPIIVTAKASTSSKTQLNITGL